MEYVDYRVVNEDHHQKKGLTLVEVMVGVLIIGLVVAGLLSALPQLRRTVIKSEQAQTAAMLINSQMEEFRTMQFDSVKTFTLSESEKEKSVNGQLFSKSVTITPVTINGVSDEAVEVAVKLSWSIQGQTMNSTSWTVFTKDGLSDKRYTDAN